MRLESRRRKLLAFSLAALTWAFAVRGRGAVAVVSVPSDDGTINSSLNVLTNQYLAPDGSVQGVVDFPMTSTGPSIIQGELNFEFYGWPPFALTVHVYGFQSTDGKITSADYNAGQFLGDMSGGYNEEWYFDATQYLRTVTTPFVGFNLRTDTDIDLFTSLEYHYGAYGHPTLLSVTSVPDPAILSPAIVVLALAVWTQRRCHMRGLPSGITC